MDTTGDGRAWLADYRRRLDELRTRAEQVQTEITALTATVTSPDGAVSATVGHSGRLSGLVLGPAAEALSRERLADLVVRTAADAAAEVSRRAERALGPLLDR
ncbi:YbaB/EbfC family nucleoid-associated protein [Pseudonocardia pini]|uniref:YbaB/EbfC family nucleoid-associated protein n=1 Tax=Pseudonocardia pini TaxID=2758030 RepID=UPI0015F10264|nr:YbaB/EbfC family nucleoid-associated protein [Pseudonocardia pini]